MFDSYSISLLPFFILNFFSLSVFLSNFSFSACSHVDLFCCGHIQRRMGASMFGAATSTLCHNNFCVATNFAKQETGDNHHLTHLVCLSLFLSFSFFFSLSLSLSLSRMSVPTKFRHGNPGGPLPNGPGHIYEAWSVGTLVRQSVMHKSKIVELHNSVCQCVSSGC